MYTHDKSSSEVIHVTTVQISNCSYRDSSGLLFLYQKNCFVWQLQCNLLGWRRFILHLGECFVIISSAIQHQHHSWRCCNFDSKTGGPSHQPRGWNTIHSITCMISCWNIGNTHLATPLSVMLAFHRRTEEILRDGGYVSKQVSLDLSNKTILLIYYLFLYPFIIFESKLKWFDAAKLTIKGMIFDIGEDEIVSK